MFHRAALHSAAAIDIVIDDKPYGHGSALHLSLLNSLRLFQINDVRTTQAGGHGPIMQVLLASGVKFGHTKRMHEVLHQADK